MENPPDYAPKNGSRSGRRDSLTVFEMLQEKVAIVGRRLSLGPGDLSYRRRKTSPCRRPRKGSCVSVISNALGNQIQTTLVGAIPLVAAKANSIHELGGGSDMGNKAASQSQSEEEGEVPRVPPLSAHTPVSGRSSALENGDDGEIEVELPSIPKMEIFSHPMAAAGGAKGPHNALGSAQDSSLTRGQATSVRGPTKPPEGSTAELASELENIVKEKMEQHESSEWDRTDVGLEPPSTCSSSLFHNATAPIEDEPPPSPIPNIDFDLSPTKGNAESKEQRDMNRRRLVIQELVETERVYVSDLAVIVGGYMHELRSEEAEAKMPEDLKDGKDKIVFGNLEAIYEWHRDYFLKNVEDFIEHPENIGPVFQRSEKKFQMYVKYCHNKPKSDYIVSEYFEFFEEMRQKLGHKLQLPDLLIKPIQRLLKYKLMLKDILKYTERAGLYSQVDSMRRAVHIMTVVPKSADDMMSVGRLQGFSGNILSQGKLLHYGSLICSEGDSLTNFKGKELFVFLFEQSIIFSEPEGKKKQFTDQQYIYKNYLQMNKMQLVELIDPCDTLKFLLKSTDPQAGKCDIAFICQESTQRGRDEWVSLIRHLLQAQKDFLKAIQSPIAYQEKQTRNGHTWLTRIESGVLEPPPPFPEREKHENRLETSLSCQEPSITVSDLMSDTHRRQSDPTFDTKKKSGELALSPTKNRKPFFRLPLKPRGRSERRHSVETESNSEHVYVNVAVGKALLAPDKGTRQVSDDRVSIEAGMNVKVLVDFTAVREDEISVYRGEVIQVLSCNQVRGFLVHRAATTSSPAAEGWVPSHVLLPPAIPHFASTSPHSAVSHKKSWIKLRKPSFTPSDHPHAIKESISLPPDNFSHSSTTPPFQKRAVALINPYNPEVSHFFPHNCPQNYQAAASSSCQNPRPFIVPDSPDAPIKFSSPLNNVSVPPGEPVEMCCKVSGQGILAESINVRWFGPQGELSDPRFEMEQHRDGTFHLHFASARRDDAGEYTCIISTGGYSVSCSAVLRVVC